jgi:hypothetical protein
MNEPERDAAEWIRETKAGNGEFERSENSPFPATPPVGPGVPPRPAPGAPPIKGHPAGTVASMFGCMIV